MYNSNGISEVHDHTETVVCSRTDDDWYLAMLVKTEVYSRTYDDRYLAMLVQSCQVIVEKYVTFDEPLFSHLQTKDFHFDARRRARYHGRLELHLSE